MRKIQRGSRLILAFQKLTESNREFCGCMVQRWCYTTICNATLLAQKMDTCNMASADDFNATSLRQRIALLWTDFKFLQHCSTNWLPRYISIFRATNNVALRIAPCNNTLMYPLYILSKRYIYNSFNRVIVVSSPKLKSLMV